MEGDGSISLNNWSGGVDADDIDAIKAVMQFDVEKIPFETAKDAYESVLKYAGASKMRDAADLRVIQQVRTGKATTGKNRNGIIDSPADVGGWPELKSLPAPKDSDNDGMPDEWEIANGLNPNDASDASLFTISKEYTNIEMYLNGLVSIN